MDNVCGKDLFLPDIVPLNRDTPIRADGDTQAEDDSRKGLCSPKMVPLDPYTSPLLQLGFTNCSKADLDYIPFGWEPPVPPGECLFCLKVDEHPSSACPYRKRVPKNATVGSGCDIVCSACERLCGGSRCHQDEAYAIFKVCCICGKIGEHWPSMCPSPLRQKDISFNRGFNSYYPGNKESLASQ
ncbi:hypothetical protein ACE6H2_013206 [Prunus campanulata]